MDKKMVCKCEEEMDRSKLHKFRREGEGGFDGNNPIFKSAHYVAIGNLFKEMEDDSRIEGESYNVILRYFNNLFESDNPKFDSDRFHEFIQGLRKR